MSQEIFKHRISKYETNYDASRNIFTIITTIESELNVVYNDLSRFLKKKEEFWPRGNYHLPGFNFTVLKDNKSDYFKILYQRTRGLDYWYNPIDVYMEIFLTNKENSLELGVQFSPTETAINKNLLELKTYLLDIIVDIWNGLGLRLESKFMNDFYPPEDIEKRKQIRKKAKENQIKLYLGFFFFCLVIYTIIMLLR